MPAAITLDSYSESHHAICATKPARLENLPVEGVVADIAIYEPDGLFDVILIDRTLHMLALTTRLAVLEVFLDHVIEGGWLLIADEASNIKEFENVISGHEAIWKAEHTRRGYLFLRRS